MRSSEESQEIDITSIVRITSLDPHYNQSLLDRCHFCLLNLALNHIDKVILDAFQRVSCWHPFLHSSLHPLPPIQKWTKRPMIHETPSPFLLLVFSVAVTFDFTASTSQQFYALVAIYNIAIAAHVYF
jgi:hypothetical protein